MANHTIDKFTYGGETYILQDNVSGYVDTDEQLKIEEVADSTSTTYTYYPILGRSTTTTGIRQIDTDGFQYYNRNGTTSAEGIAQLTLGNSTASGTAGNKPGSLNLYGSGAYAGLLKAGNLTAARTYTLPNDSGTIALTNDIPSMYSDLSSNTFTLHFGTDAATFTLAEGNNITIAADSEGSNDVTYTISATGGASYTATSPIDITNGVISHDTSGVTAGTYDGGMVKSTGFYVPSFTVDSTGHITSATDLGTLLPDLTSSNSASVGYGVLGPYEWATGLRTYTAYGSTLTAGNTSTTITISSDMTSGYSYQSYFRVVDVQAYDAVTFEPVIVDWTASAINSAGSSITLTVSIAAAWPNTIRFFTTVTYATGIM